MATVFLPRFSDLDRTQYPVTERPVGRLSDYFARHPEQMNDPYADWTAYLPGEGAHIPIKEYVNLVKQEPSLTDIFGRASGEADSDPWTAPQELFMPFGGLKALGVIGTNWSKKAGTKAAEEVIESTSSKFESALNKAIDWGAKFNVNRQMLEANPFARVRLSNEIKRYLDALDPSSMARQVAEKYYKTIGDPMDPYSAWRIEKAAQAVHAAMKAEATDLGTLLRTEYGDEAPIVVNKIFDKVTSARGKDRWLDQTKKLLTSQRGSFSNERLPKLESSLSVAPEREEAIQEALKFTAGSKGNIINQINKIRETLRTDENLQKSLVKEFEEYAASDGPAAALNYIRQRYLGIGDKYLNTNDDIFNILQKGYENGWIAENPLVQVKVPNGVFGLKIPGSKERGGRIWERYIDINGNYSYMPAGQLQPVEKGIVEIGKDILKSERGTFSNKEIKDLVREETYRKGATSKGKRLQQPTSLTNILGETYRSEPVGLSQIVTKQTKPDIHEYTVGELLQLLESNPKDARAIIGELLSKMKE